MFSSCSTAVIVLPQYRISGSNIIDKKTLGHPLFCPMVYGFVLSVCPVVTCDQVSLKGTKFNKISLQSII
jgi:hypothetical protein